MENKAISFMIRGVKVLRSSSTPVFRTLPFGYCVEGFSVDGNEIIGSEGGVRNHCFEQFGSFFV